MKSVQNRLLNCIKQALPSGIRTSIWLIKLTLPVSFAVLLFDYWGFLEIMAQYTSPIFQIVGLPGVAAIVLVTSVTTNVYAVAAVLTTLALPERDGTILAVMCLISHAFIIETAILKKTGSSALRMVLLRLIASFVVGAILNLILPGSATEEAYSYHSIQGNLQQIILDWLPIIALTLLKIVILVNTLLILQRFLEEFGIIKYLIKPLAPLMKFLGLPKQASFLWIVGYTIGLSYGAAIMLQKVEEGQIEKEECDLLNHHLSISHSQMEDPLLFISLGYSLPVLIIPRLVLAILAVWLRRLENYLRKTGKEVKLSPVN